MEIVYARKEATAAEVREDLADPPSYSAVRATMRILEEKGLLVHAEDGPRYVFRPRVPREKAARQAIRGLLRAYFDGSVENAIASLIRESGRKLKDADYEQLLELIRKAREEDA